MKKAAILLIYIALLLCVRWFWSDTFGTEQQPKVENGVLDLRGIHLDDRHSIVLDGEWEFYPDMLISGSRQADQAKDGRRYIQFPAIGVRLGPTQTAHRSDTALTGFASSWTSR